MASTRIPGPLCQVLNWLDLDTGTLCRSASPTPGTVQPDQLSAQEIAGGVQGKITGLGPDITAYLQAVGEFFGVHIKVTSGLRDADAQANAMFDNWIKLERGGVYAKVSLPEKNRAAMNGYYKIAMETPGATPDDKKAAKEKFLELGRLVKSRHSGGRAADIWLASINPKARRAILMKMNEVKEGTRTDIIHVESVSLIHAPDAHLYAKWKIIRDGKAPHAHASSNSSNTPCACE